MPAVAVTFAHSRCNDGTDVAAAVRRGFPEAEIRAQLDESGAVSGYTVVMQFETVAGAAEAAFEISEYFLSQELPYEVAFDG